MSHWNHRVVKSTKGEEKVFLIHEVYYSDDGTINGWTNPVYPQGETLEELQADFENQKRAFEKPLLETVTINGEEKLIEASMSEALE